MRDHKNTDYVTHPVEELARRAPWTERVAIKLVDWIGTLQFAAAACLFAAIWFKWGPSLGIDNSQRSYLNFIFSMLAMVFQSLTLLAVKTSSRLASIKADADYRADMHSAETLDEMLPIAKKSFEILKRIDKNTGGESK